MNESHTTTSDAPKHDQADTIFVTPGRLFLYVFDVFVLANAIIIAAGAVGNWPVASGFLNIVDAPSFLLFHPLSLFLDAPFTTEAGWAWDTARFYLIVAFGPVLWGLAGALVAYLANRVKI